MATAGQHFARLVPQAYADAKKVLDQAEKDRVKAGETAVRVEGFRLKGLLSKEIRAGAPGGKPFKEISMIARSLGKTKIPYRKLASVTRYNAVKTADRFAMEIGFLDSGRAALSKKWIQIAGIAQEGGNWTPSKSLRRYLAMKGTALTSRSKFRKFFFIKKATTEFKTPARPIIDPFWTAHKGEALKNVESNYVRKLAGEKI